MTNNWVGIVAGHVRFMQQSQYLTKRESPCGESGLHRQSPDLTPELQSTVWADEVVVAAQELKMFFERVLRTRMGERSPRQRG